MATRGGVFSAQGRSAQGRWGVEDSYPVLYLGKPIDSVIVEGYRHLIDPVDGPPPPIRPRMLITCEVSVSEILDLRLAANRVLVGLTMQQLQSETYDRDAYRTCQNMSAAAHQLGYHGLVAPAATRLGETLALFTDRLPHEERPVRTRAEMWVELPPDPRKTRQGNHLRVVR
jgi:RES domain-containing protein